MLSHCLHTPFTNQSPTHGAINHLLRVCPHRFDQLRFLPGTRMKFATSILCWLALIGIAPNRAFAEAESAAIGQLRQHLDISPDQRPLLGQQRFARVRLTKEDVAIARSLLAEDRLAFIRRERGEEMEAKRISHGQQEMPLFFKRFGDKPDNGWSLYISMHGGGGTAPRVNDAQWENQKRLYQLKEGIYVAPRAPTDTWN